jgi:hypothetical protein
MHTNFTEPSAQLLQPQTLLKLLMDYENMFGRAFFKLDWSSYCVLVSQEFILQFGADLPPRTLSLPPTLSNNPLNQQGPAELQNVDLHQRSHSS